MTAPGAERLRSNLIWLLFAGLAIRVITPVGYMPAPIGDGGPFVLCPGAFFGASLLVDNGAATDAILNPGAPLSAYVGIRRRFR